MSFLDFARGHGLLIDHLASDARIHRCPTVTHERKKNGAYMFDGQRGWVFAWDGEAKTHWFADENATPWSEEEKRAVAERRRAQQRRIEAGHQRAAQEARRLLGTAKKAPSAYLTFKGFRDPLPRHTKPEERHGHGLCLPDGALIVPMWSVSREIQGAQIIRWNPETRQHEKKMLPGMNAKGAVFWIGTLHPNTVWLCEGYATSLSIKMALDSMKFRDAAVFACFSDFNLVHVAPHVPGRKFVFADNDKSGAGERAAKATGLPYCMSETEGFDANDEHCKNGLFAVCGLIQRARLMACA